MPRASRRSPAADGQFSDWPRVPCELVDFLEGIYREHCIKADELLIPAHRRSAKVELVKQLRIVAEAQRKG